MAAANRNNQATSPFEQLPVDVLTNVLEYMNLAERIQLFQLNTTILRRVSRECTTLWENISLRGCSDEQVEAITDQQFSALLVRVDARHVTKWLELYDDLIQWMPPNFLGPALEPLRHSRVLEYVSIAGHELNTEVVYGILRTCIPFRLYKVKVERRGQDINEEGQQFSRDLEAAQHTRQRYLQTIEDHIKCSTCNQLVASKEDQIIPQVFGMPSFRCSGVWCEYGYYCRRASCLGATRHCGKCGRLVCSMCFGLDTCSLCKVSFCENCKNVKECRVCEVETCSDCNPVTTCVAVSENADFECENKNLCSRCVEQRGVSYYECCGCGGACCNECQADGLIQCTGCQGGFCQDCGWNKVRQCASTSCNSTRCDECGVVSCSVCHEQVCDACIVRRRGRSKPVCRDCASKETTSRPRKRQKA